jgi:hypothetical protein
MDLFTHFLILVFLAVPANLRSAAAALHFAIASRSHFFRNEFLAAPASFFSCAAALQVGAGVCAKDTVSNVKLVKSTKIVVWISFIIFILIERSVYDCGPRRGLLQWRFNYPTATMATRSLKHR